MRSIYDLTLPQLTDILVENGFKKYHAQQIYAWLYRRQADSFEAMTDLSKALRQWLAEHFSGAGLTMLDRQAAQDGTRKYLFALSDGAAVETVLMHYDYGDAVCVSSEVGCNMGCTFCASGLLKKRRGLTAGEMVLQVMSVQNDVAPDGVRVSHIVVMGTGEPFDNYDNVLDFCRIVNDDKGLGIGARHITISTCGIVPGIRRFADENVQFNLAVSLHAPNDELRSKIMPINRAYPLDQLMEALRYYASKNNRRLSFEYILLKGVNDTPECVEQLARLTRPFDVYVNHIPYNTVDENGYAATDYKTALALYDQLMSRHVRCTLRQKHGADIDAACGQLRSRYLREKDGHGDLRTDR
jgi:23S rRNA (adenine2503-C2)-methyltransferase